jgi:hypothetical protein
MLDVIAVMTPGLDDDGEEEAEDPGVISAYPYGLSSSPAGVDGTCLAGQLVSAKMMMMRRRRRRRNLLLIR